MEKEPPESPAEELRPATSRGRHIGSIVSSFVALLALFIAAYTVYIQRQQLKVQAWPRLTFEMEQLAPSRPNQVRFAVSLWNRGVAPTEVQTMHLEFAGEEITDWLTWFDRLARSHGLTAKIRPTKADTPIGTVIGVGQSFKLLEIESVQAAALVQADDATTLSVCYCSLIDDCWLLRVAATGESTTSPIARCPTYAKKFVGLPAAKSRAWAESALEQAAAGIVDAGVNEPRQPQ